MGYGDRINPDRQKYKAGASIEDNILGILMLRPDYLNDKSITEKLNSDMFLCEFNRRIFNHICELTQSPDESFDVGALGQFFTPEEMGAIMKMQVMRSGLENNSPQVLEELIQRLAEQNEKNKSQDISLEDYLESLRNKKS